MQADEGTEPSSVANVLARIGGRSSFAVRRKLPAHDLRLEVAGVGMLRFPISSAAALALRDVARPARHGYKAETRLDKSVRDTWEIPKSKITIDEPRWRKALDPALEAVARELGLPPGSRLRPALHNMLVYGPGQFFATHQDSEKSEGMIASLVVTLPSVAVGGALVVEHHDAKIELRGSRDHLGLIAFYADCHHEVRPVTSGYRVALTYNLVLSNTGAAPAAVPGEQLEALEACVREHFRAVPISKWPGAPPEAAPDRLVYLLDHEYTQSGLHWTLLKHADAARVAALLEIAGRLDCEIALALADVHESWACEDDYDPGQRYRYDEEDEDDDDDDDGDGDGGDYELTDLIDSSVELRHFVDAGGDAQDVASVVDGAELHFTKPSVDLDPFKSEHEGYMGNYGNTVDRWYHRAAVVLWPRARTFLIRAKASARWGIREIARALGRRELDEARKLTSELLPFWPRVARDETSSLVEDTLYAARALVDPRLAAGLVGPLSVEDLSPKEAPALVEVVIRYGLPWLRRAHPSFAGKPSSEHGRYGAEAPRLTWLETLPAFVESARETDDAEGRQLAEWVVADQWSWLRDVYGAAAKQSRPTARLTDLAGLDKAIVALLDAALLAGATSLHGGILAFLTSSVCPPLAIASMLQLARSTHGRRVDRLRLEPLRAHTTHALTKELEQPPRAADDWSIAPPRGCPCALCTELARFLTDPARTRFEWPLAKDRRAHVHGVIDSHELPVTHVTRRTGSPYTLVLEKTHALFDREAKSRAAKQAALAKLGPQQTAPSGA